MEDCLTGCQICFGQTSERKRERERERKRDVTGFMVCCSIPKHNMRSVVPGENNPLAFPFNSMAVCAMKSAHGCS